MNSNLLFLFADNLSSNESEDDFKPQEQKSSHGLGLQGDLYRERHTQKYIQFRYFPAQVLYNAPRLAPGRNLDNYDRELLNIKKKECERVNLKCISSLSKLVPRILFLRAINHYFMHTNRNQKGCPTEGLFLLNVLILPSLCYLCSQDSNINLTWLNYATYCFL